MLYLCRFAGLPYRALLAVASVGVTALAAAAVGQSVAQQFGPPGNFERCRAMTDDAARLRCYEQTTSKPTKVAPALGPGTGSWRLVRTRNPAGGPDAVSIMQSADITRSDLGLAGLMLRCGEPGVEVLVVLVQPLPPRAHPKVTLNAAGHSADFTATVVPPGAATLLPKDASPLATGTWTSAAELSVQVDTAQGTGEPTSIHGVVPLTGLGSALPALMAACPSPQ